MKSIEIDSALGRTGAVSRTCVGSGLLKRLQDLYTWNSHSQIVVITDKNVASHWLEPLRSSLSWPLEVIELEPGEQTKTIETAISIWERLIELECDRELLLVALGGGMVGDLTGFVASNFLRGVGYVQLPTSLLAQVDACMGGKTGVNLSGGKNLVGAFYNPGISVCDVATLQTLPLREFRAGCAEVIKYALIQDAELFTLLEECSLDALAEGERIEEVVLRSLNIKAAIVEEDQFESGWRRVLNFGHTAGHALESESLEGKSPLLHGEAVAWGIWIAAQLSVEEGGLSASELDSIGTLIESYGFSLNLPPEISREGVIGRLRFDKKRVRGDTQWILLDSIGKASIDQKVPKGVVENLIYSS